ncbi:hypothetical protein D9M68_250450 [compost metagenome]
MSPLEIFKRKANRAKLLLLRIFFFTLAIIGGVALFGLGAFAIKLDEFGRAAADRILANAIRPAGREMPVTAGSIPYGSGDIQILGGMGQGLSCSLPRALESRAFPTSQETSPIGLRMRQACVYHDYCYRHGAATYGYTQADCDFALQAQAFRLCAFIEKLGTPDANGRRKESKCMQDARLVTLGVRIGGSDSFRTLDASSVPSIDEPDREGSRENSSTYFEFDSYPTKSNSYTVYRIADAPAEEHLSPGTKAIYRFKIRPSGIDVSYSVNYRRYRNYATIPGNPLYLTSAPLVVRANSAKGPVDWFVWWQRVSEDETTGRLAALAPGSATSAEFACFSMTQGCPDRTQSTVLAELGKAKEYSGDPQIDQLRPADLRLPPRDQISLVTLRNHSCRGSAGNAPCYVPVLVDTDVSAPRWQPQEPLSIDDRISPKPQSIDRDRYRNFASLPFVLEPPGSNSPLIAWTRRDENYREDAYLRRAAVNRGTNEASDDDTAVSQGTALLSGFSEADEPAVVIGSSSLNPILLSISAGSESEGAGPSVIRQWTLPPADVGDKAPTVASVSANFDRCRPDLEASWLSRPPQILGESDGSAIAVFTRLRPSVSDNWTTAKVQIATLVIQPNGSCAAPAWRGPEILVSTSRPSPGDENKDPIERGRNAYIRISRAPALLADLDRDGLFEVILPQGTERDTPLPICELTPGGTCTL